jgi:hypothetical protein
MLDELARVVLATDRENPMLHIMEIACGANALGCTSEELAEAVRRQREVTSDAALNDRLD